MNGKNGEKLRFRAAIILGIVSLLHTSLFTNNELKEIAEALEIVLRNDPKGTYRVTAIELVGLGFRMWKPYYDGSSIIRLFVGYTGFMESDQSLKKNPTDSTSPNNSSIHPLITYNARHAILDIAHKETDLFVQTVTHELSNSKSSNERGTFLHVLGYVMEKNPVLLQPSLTVIIESMIKSLDPHTPNIRDALLPLLTQTIADIVKRFPNIAFNNVTQRLIVGTSDGTCLLYDIRTASRIQVIDVKIYYLLNNEIGIY